MKYSYYLASLYLLISTYSQHYQIEDKYRGAPFFRKININKLEKDYLRYLSIYKLGEPTLLTDSHFDFEKQNEFNDALYKFGWARTSLMYSEYFTYKKKSNTLLNYTKHMHKEGKGGYAHHHHLHICGFNHDLIVNIRN